MTREIGSHSRIRSPSLMLFLLAPAVGAVLARDAQGVAYLPDWASALAQMPLVVAWTLSQARWFVRSAVRGVHSTPVTSQASRLLEFFDGALLAVVAIVAAVMAIWHQSPSVFFTATTCFVAGQLFLEWLTDLYRRLDERILEPAGFMGLIVRPWFLLMVAGAILLSLPLATHSSVPDYRHNFWLHVLHCAYTSTSAACLVGVGVYDFGDDLTLFGQIVVVLITQLSGMAFAALGLAAIQPFLTRVIRLRSVLMTSLLLQGAAVALLWNAWTATDAPTAFQRFWWSVVHTGSALWNSGWMLRSDGLAAYLGDSFVFTAITTLSIAGSLGIPILLDLLKATDRKEGAVARPLLRPAWRRLPQWEAGGALAMLLLGAALLFLFETPRLMPEKWAPPRPVDFGEGRVSIRDNIGFRARWSMSVFVSATLRSAGLQSIPLSKGAVSWPTYVVMLAWMIVGGSAAGVAGGMRLSTLLLMAMPILSGRASWTTPGGPAVKALLLRAAIRWIVLWLLLNACAIFLLAATTDGTRYEQVFEAVTALNNVGLSTGLSLHLTWTGRLAMIALMILGRLLPAAFWLSLSLEVIAALRTTSTRPADAA